MCVHTNSHLSGYLSPSTLATSQPCPPLFFFEHPFLTPLKMIRENEWTLTRSTIVAERPAEYFPFKPMLSAKGPSWLLIFIMSREKTHFKTVFQLITCSSLIKFYGRSGFWDEAGHLYQNISAFCARKAAQITEKSIFWDYIFFEIFSYLKVTNSPKK